MALSETIDFKSIQTTSIFQHDSVKSEEANKLLQAFGVGNNFLSSGFEMTLQSSTDVTTSVVSVYAVLTPGIYVQDTTVINFKDNMPSDSTINIKLYNTGNVPGPGTIIYVGSQYYHGTVGDGINATPTYANLLKTLALTSYSNFVPFYKISFLSGYSGINDFTNIKIERLIPSIKYNGCGTPEPKYTATDDNQPVYGDDRVSEDSMLWALVL